MLCKIFLTLVYGTLCCFISTCTGGATLKTPFRSFNHAYADTLNEQMLLNVARAYNGHPPYYLVIGTITNKFEMHSEVTGGGDRQETRSSGLDLARNHSSDSSLNRGEGGALGLVGRTIGATVNRTVSSAVNTVTSGNVGGTLSATSSPEFQFIPLNNNDIAKQFLDPIPIQVFQNLFDQGYPIDMLMRVLVERAEMSKISNAEGTTTLVMVNSPVYGLLRSKGGEVKVTPYAMFLRSCDMLRELQLAGHLALKSSTETVLVSYSTTAPSGEDQIKAQAAGFSYRLNADKVRWEMTRQASDLTFVIRAERVKQARRDLREIFSHVKEGEAYDPVAVDELVDMLAETEESKIAKGSQPAASSNDALGSANFQQLMTRVAAADSAKAKRLVPGMSLLNSTASKQRPSTQQTEEPQYQVMLALRSYNRALEAVSIEQDLFDKLKLRDLFVVREEKRIPILRTLWNDGSNSKDSLLSVRYEGKVHKITDERDAVPERARWNRDVFKLLVALSSQVSVDLSKYQRSVIELR